MKFTIYTREKIERFKDIVDLAPCEKDGIFKPDRCYTGDKKKDCKRCFKYEVEIKLAGEIK